MEVLEKNLEWLKKKMQHLQDQQGGKLTNLLVCFFSKHSTNLVHSETYFLFDCPGQIELYTHHKSVHNILHTIHNKWNFRVSLRVVIIVRVTISVCTFTNSVLDCIG